ncbi:iron-sulfur cluster assembly accessory protein [Pleionea sp. CnH1-48]|uniref:HesB/IscA family protein n=1 Tax=Pleionea sp. CnH1-48 TaxID=2954494 RepID=UPI00209826B4|nr:iron-sulfur cluster assembly accessory protein [Pleionea sp. CnH1-48]MCO7226868.1 iron-sulfur cluster assembly accessory protein [Pleionea sp. CnH1-48]
MTVETFTPGEDLSMTDKAVRHFKRQVEKNDASAVRLWVKESGCSGYMYELDFVNQAEDSDKTFEFDGLTLFVAQDALTLLMGTEIDYATEGVNSIVQFNNPNAKAMCGCGESFVI